MAASSPPPFQALLDAHGRDVLGFLVASVGPVDAEDCFQETFLAALRAYPRVEHGRNLRSWLLTIAHRKAIDHHRARQRRPLPAGRAEELPRSAQEPERNGGGELWPLVQELPPKQRGAVLLRFAIGMDYAEIATALDSSQEAARRNVHEGLKKLRKELA